MSFTFKEHGRPSERFRERVRCTYDGIDQKTGAHNWRGDKHQDFERIIAFGLVVSYDITNLCATRETSYIFQFSVKHNGERTYVYPQNLEAYGVTVTSFALASVENAP